MDHVAITTLVDFFKDQPDFLRALNAIRGLFDDPSLDRPILVKSLHRYTVSLARKHNISLDLEEPLAKRPRRDDSLSLRSTHSRQRSTAEDSPSTRPHATSQSKYHPVRHVSCRTRRSTEEDSTSTAIDHLNDDITDDSTDDSTDDLYVDITHNENDDTNNNSRVTGTHKSVKRRRLIRRATMSNLATEVERNVISVTPEATTTEIHTEPRMKDGTTWIESRLHKTVLPISRDSDCTATIEARSHFYQRVRDLEVQPSRDIGQGPYRFQNPEVVEITNFFFSDMIGPKALKRLSTLVESYNQKDKGIPTIQSAVRAGIVATDPNTPVELRPFFSMYSRAAKDIPDEDSIFQQIHQVQYNLEFLAEYNSLRSRAEKKDPVLIQLLRTHGIRTKPGWSIMSCLIKYVTDTLQMTTSQLSNFVQSIQAIDTITKHFTRGVIVLLPPRCGGRFCRWGLQRMAAVYPIFNEEVPVFRELCQTLEVVLLQPILQGSPLPFTRIETGNGLSLQQRIDQADSIEEIE